jgi:hypothetical protein
MSVWITGSQEIDSIVFSCLDLNPELISKLEIRYRNNETGSLAASFVFQSTNLAGIVDFYDWACMSHTINDGSVLDEPQKYTLYIDAVARRRDDQYFVDRMVNRILERE